MGAAKGQHLGEHGGAAAPLRPIRGVPGRERDFFAEVAAHSYTRVTIGTEDGAVSVNGFVTSGNYFTMLGLVPSLGRLYTEDDEASVVLSQRLWRSRFGADPHIIGRVVSINRRPFTVVGVVGSGFTGTMSTFTGDLWVPWMAFKRLTEVSVRVVPLARLRPEVPRAVAEERVDELARALPGPADATVQGARLESMLWRSDLSGCSGSGPRCSWPPRRFFCSSRPRTWAACSSRAPTIAGRRSRCASPSGPGVAG